MTGAADRDGVGVRVLDQRTASSREVSGAEAAVDDQRAAEALPQLLHQRRRPGSVCSTHR